MNKIPVHDCITGSTGSTNFSPQKIINSKLILNMKSMSMNINKAKIINDKKSIDYIITPAEYMKKRHEYFEKNSLPFIVDSNNIAKLYDLNKLNEDSNIIQDEHEKDSKQNHNLWKENSFTPEKNHALNSKDHKRNERHKINLQKVPNIRLLAEDSSPQVNSARVYMNSFGDMDTFLRKSPETSRDIKNIKPNRGKAYYKHRSHNTMNVLPTVVVNNQKRNMESDSIANLKSSIIKTKNNSFERHNNSRYSIKNMVISQRSREKMQYLVHKFDTEGFIHNSNDLSYPKRERSDHNDDNNTSRYYDKFDKIIDEYKKKSERGILLSENMKYNGNKMKCQEIDNLDKIHDKDDQIMKNYRYKLKEFTLIPDSLPALIKKTYTNIKYLGNDNHNEVNTMTMNSINTINTIGILNTNTNTNSNTNTNTNSNANTNTNNILGKLNNDKGVNEEKDFVLKEKAFKRSLTFYINHFKNYSKENDNNSTTKDSITLKNRYKTIRKKLRAFLLKLKRLNITLTEFFQKKVFSTKSYDKEYSKEFIKAAKKGDMIILSKLLVIDKYLVYAFDYIGQTALHWACKRKLYDVAKYLIQQHSDPDAQDIAGRSPLYFAMKASNADLVQILLFSKASPWGTETMNYKNLTDDSKCKWLLKKARQLDILISFKSIKEKDFLWKLEADKFLVDPNDIITKR